MPITFFVGPCIPDGADPWDDWSRARFDAVVVPFLEDYTKRNRLPDEVEPSGDIDPITKTHIACLLQYVEAGDALKKRFPI